MRDKITPLVSVCISAYNAEAYIADCLASVLNQTYFNIEVIVVDDSSTDSTYAVASRFSSKKVKVLTMPKGGAALARNMAKRQAVGEFIKFLDADDLINPTMIESQVALALKNPGCIITGKWGRFYNNDLSTFSFNQEQCWQTLDSSAWIKASWKGAQPMLQCGLFLIPAQLSEAAGGWDERLSLIDDFEFFTRVILTSESVIFSDDSILYYRSGNPFTLSGSKSKKAVESACLSVALATEHLLAVEDNIETRALCADCFQSVIYDFYFSYPDLIKPLEEKVEALGGSTLKMGGGKLFVLLSNLIGWKLAGRIKRVIN